MPLTGCSKIAIAPPGNKLKAFSAAEFETVRKVADRILPGQEGTLAASALDVARAADTLVARLNLRLRNDLHQVLHTFEAMPMMALSFTPFSKLEGAAADRYLANWEDSWIPALRQAFQGLRRMVAGIYYADPRSWGPIAYDGPWVGNRDMGYGLDNESFAPGLVNPNVYLKFAE